jgi:hypothetical protein
VTPAPSNRKTTLAKEIAARFGPRRPGRGFAAALRDLLRRRTRRRTLDGRSDERVIEPGKEHGSGRATVRAERHPIIAAVRE